MSTVTLRTVKGSELTWAELDANFTALNADKLELGATFAAGTANAALYFNASKVLSSSANLTFNGTALAVTGTLSASGATTISAQLTASTGDGTYPIISKDTRAFSAGVTGPQLGFFGLDSTSTNNSLGAIRALAQTSQNGTLEARVLVNGSIATIGTFTSTGLAVTGTLTTSSTVTINGGTANGLAYLDGSKVLTTGAALTFDGALLTNNQTSVAVGTLLNLQNTTTGSFIQFSQPGVANLFFGCPNADAFTWRTFGSGTYPEKMRLDPTGLAVTGTLSATTGAAVGGATAGAGGLAFPATAVAVANANTLDDYEEGTWTPNQGSGLTVVGAFSSIGRYTKMGNVVTVWGDVTGGTSIAVAAIGFICSNLPFSMSSDIGAEGSATGFWTSMNSVAHISTGNLTSVYSTQAISGSATIGFTITYRF